MHRWVSGVPHPTVNIEAPRQLLSSRPVLVLVVLSITGSTCDTTHVAATEVIIRRRSRFRHS
jgi:hypothetical protein